MAKRRRDKKRTRDAFDVSSPPRGLRFGNKQRLRQSYDVLEDRRYYHPEGRNRPVGARPVKARRLVAGSGSRRRAPRSRPFEGHFFSTEVFPSSRVEFSEPRGVRLCRRRKERREVLHALRHSGKGGQRRPRWTLLSKIICRRK